jgi:hypothetical protein
MQRRQFIKLSATLAAGIPLLHGCKPVRKLVAGKIVGASAQLGHLLRDGKISGPPQKTIQTGVVIIGGGVSGLTAARELGKAGIEDLVLLDLEPETGGNASCGHNNVSGFPWGAHYVPIPNPSQADYLLFLQECGVITGFSAEGKPVFNEYYLCQDPQERLYINGSWQDGIVPHFGLPDKELAQLRSFFEKMQQFRLAKGNDGLDAFAIPVDHSSKDTQYASLDALTMKEWLQQQHLDSPALAWYVNYCTRDDFGTPYDRISAWAGIHYFAGRKGVAANARSQDVLTWPEGNGFLAGALRKAVPGKIYTNALATRVQNLEAGGVEVQYYDAQAKQLCAIKARQCIMAVPQFIAARLLQDTARTGLVHSQLQYAPWMVANLRVRNQLQERGGAPLSWDNVLYESNALGYVEATHQVLAQHKEQLNLTYYMPLSRELPAAERQLAQKRTHAEWTTMILDDLHKVHPNIADMTEEINVMVWGHAMACPLPGWIHGTARLELQRSLGANIHFAHSDLAGISIFEEAFNQGVTAARKVIASWI